MKKRIGLFLVVLFLLQTAVAQANVESQCPLTGAIVTGITGEKFCVSGVYMNWYTIFSQCEATGLALAPVTELCNTKDKVWL